MRARVIPSVPPSATRAGLLIVQTRAFAGRFLPEIALGLFCVLNLAWLASWRGAETLPVYFLFTSVSVVFGLRMWSVRSSLLALVAVSVPPFLLVIRAIEQGREGRIELAEIPMMSTLFLLMVWHVYKRQRAADHEHALFGNASHELMTPLTIARGEIELLGRDDVAPSLEELRKTRDVVLEELQRSQVLAAGLLTLARLDTAFTAQRSPVSTDALIEAAVQRWSRVTNRPLLIAERAGGEIFCVRQDIALLLDNLIENALRHSAAGSAVTISARARGRRLLLEVNDEGNGIPDDALPYIFDRFYRARSADGTRGSGLGLAIVKAIAETHGGTIDVQSELGVGTTFRVQLPGFESVT